MLSFLPTLFKNTSTRTVQNGAVLFLQGECFPQLLPCFVFFAKAQLGLSGDQGQRADLHIMWEALKFSAKQRHSMANFFVKNGFLSPEDLFLPKLGGGGRGDSG